MFVLQIFIIVSTFVVAQVMCFKVIPERSVVKYINPKYIKELTITAFRTSRKSPYYINCDGESITEIGNNVSTSMKLLEYISGRYVPTPVQMEWKMCDFFNKEPFLGQMYMKQLREKAPNITCPLPKGAYHVHNLVMLMEDFPFNIPFTFEPVTVKTRGDVAVYMTDTKEIIAKGEMYYTIIQKPRKNKNEKKKTGQVRVGLAYKGLRIKKPLN